MVNKRRKDRDGFEASYWDISGIYARPVGKSGVRAVDLDRSKSKRSADERRRDPRSKGHCANNGDER